MRIGLVSDLHGQLPSPVFDLLAGVDRILCAGDVERAELLTDLEAIAPVSAVWGNVDGPEVRAASREELSLRLEGIRFAVAHGHRVAPRFELLLARFPDADVVVHGHSHVPASRVLGGRRLVNPGSARLPRGGWPPSVALAEIGRDGLRVVHLALPDGRAFEVTSTS
jgi:putative phosphoesterase